MYDEHTLFKTTTVSGGKTDEEARTHTSRTQNTYPPRHTGLHVETGIKRSWQMNAELASTLQASLFLQNDCNSSRSLTLGVAAALTKRLNHDVRDTSYYSS